MWWDIAPERKAEFEDWHTHEHFQERMGIPGFRRGTRWAAVDGGEGFFVMYELAAYETLVSPAYLARLNAPTPWSARMMPHHRHMVRSQCRVLESQGSTLSRHALTVRLSPAEGAAERLRGHLGGLARTLASRPGLTAGHLLQNQTPKIDTRQSRRSAAARIRRQTGSSSRAVTTGARWSSSRRRRSATPSWCTPGPLRAAASFAVSTRCRIPSRPTRAGSGPRRASSAIEEAARTQETGPSPTRPPLQSLLTRVATQRETPWQTQRNDRRRFKAS